MPTSAVLDDIMRSATFPQSSAEMQNTQPPASDLSINTRFSANTTSPFSTVPQPTSAYASPMHANLDLDMTSPYQTMPLSMDMNDPLSMMPTDMNMFPNTQFTGNLMDPSSTHDFTTATATTTNTTTTTPTAAANMPLPPQDQYRSESSSATPDIRSNVPTRTSSSQDQSSLRSTPLAKSDEQSSSSINPSQMTLQPLKNREPVTLSTGNTVNPTAFTDMTFPWQTPVGGFPSTMHSNPHINTQFKNAYSSTGFDMLGVLVRRRADMCVLQV